MAFFSKNIEQGILHYRTQVSGDAKYFSMECSRDK